jgi:hypothetical protein
VDNLVDNPAVPGENTACLVDELWIAEESQNRCRHPLVRAAAVGVELLYRRRRIPARRQLLARGQGRETGSTSGYVGPAAGQASPGGRATGRWARTGPGEAPPSHTWRGLVLFSPGPGRAGCWPWLKVLRHGAGDGHSPGMDTTAATSVSRGSPGQVPAAAGTWCPCGSAPRPGASAWPSSWCRPCVVPRGRRRHPYPAPGHRREPPGTGLLPADGVLPHRCPPGRPARGTRPLGRGTGAGPQ